MANAENPDSLPQAAQSMRELLDRIPLQYEGAPKFVPVGKAADDMNTVTDAFVKAKQTSKCFVERTVMWEGDIDAPLRVFLGKVEVMVDERNKTISKKERKKKFIRMQDPTREPLPDIHEETALKQWREYDDYFQAVAHHNRVVTAEEFAASVDGCVRMLLGHLKPPTSTTIDALDELIRKAEGK